MEVCEDASRARPRRRGRRAAAPIARPSLEETLDTTWPVFEAETNSVRVETVTRIEDFESLRPAWEGLLAATGNELPFYLFDWQLLWWKHFRNDQRSVRDSLRVKVVRADDGSVVAIAPLLLSERRTLGAIWTRTYQFIGADPKITEIKGPLCSPQHERAAAQALVDDLRGESRWDWIRWCGLGKESEFTRALGEASPFDWVLEDVDYVLPLARTWDEFKKGLKRNIRESLRHCYNSLKRDNLDFRFETAESPADMSAALDTFARLHALRANVKDATPHPDRFARRTTREFIDDVGARLAERGIAKVFTLRIGGQPVASRIGFRVGDSLYLYYSGYDPAWGKYSVMTTALAESIRWAIGQGLKTVNLSIGTDVSKTRWGAVGVPLVNAVQVRPSLRSRAIYESSRVAYKARKDPKLQELANRAPLAKAFVGKLLARRSWT